MNRRRQDVATVRISDEEYSRLESKFEALKNEFTACRRKLDSKCEALLILSKELDQCRSERDQFKLMAEQLRERCHTLKTSLSGKVCIHNLSNFVEHLRFKHMYPHLTGLN
ncbi:uncharacterized protein LOC132728166 [Ruditapes philippinarum]|uniref:uncharacterized protein LOC132728166 n=1 Tax=Ruditapes philippinarum TaxID=129788 RepID=UPI00295C1F57|nr:uncharacterized protein LOC132728166 [Ruditapes philippinarum]